MTENDRQFVPIKLISAGTRLEDRSKMRLRYLGFRRGHITAMHGDGLGNKGDSPGSADHSTFCTCSLIRSIAPLTSTMRRLI